MALQKMQLHLSVTAVLIQTEKRVVIVVVIVIIKGNWKLSSK
jgi:hypothetical protein